LNKPMTLWLATCAIATFGAFAGQARAQSTAPAESTTAQRQFGDVNPKLAELTDNVLFGDVWARPGLSLRDRSLVTVSAL
jgi:4-carboxymuconolactone decarboxylase